MMRKYFNIDHNNQFTLDRRYFINHGLPKENTHIANGNILYDASTKERKCEICNIRYSKYDWEQIQNHLNTKRTINFHTYIRNNTIKGPSVDKSTSQTIDRTIQREIDFGFLKIEYEQNNEDDSDPWSKILVCAKCGENILRKK